MEACQSSALMHEEERTQFCDSWRSMNFETAVAGDVDEDSKMISQRSCSNKYFTNSAYFMNPESYLTKNHLEIWKIGKFGKHLFAVLFCSALVFFPPCFHGVFGIN